MLHSLYKKLNICFITMMMGIITLIIGVVGFSNLQLKRVNDSSSFQRLTTLLIDQLEADELNATLIIQSYESKNNFFCRLKDENGTILYQSLTDFKTPSPYLLNELNTQNERIKMIPLIPTSQTTQTTHGGVFRLKGLAHDSYLGSSHELFTKNGTRYTLDLLYREESPLTFLKIQLPLSLFFWLLSLIGVSLTSRFLLKKALAPTEAAIQSQKRSPTNSKHH